MQRSQIATDEHVHTANMQHLFVLNMQLPDDDKRKIFFFKKLLETKGEKIKCGSRSTCCFTQSREIHSFTCTLQTTVPAPTTTPTRWYAPITFPIGRVHRLSGTGEGRVHTEALGVSGFPFTELSRGGSTLPLPTAFSILFIFSLAHYC